MDRDFLVSMMRAWLYGLDSLFVDDAPMDMRISNLAKDCAEHLVGNWEMVQRCNAFILANDYPWGDA